MLKTPRWRYSRLRDGRAAFTCVADKRGMQVPLIGGHDCFVGGRSDPAIRVSDKFEFILAHRRNQLLLICESSGAFWRVFEPAGLLHGRTVGS
jgi:hypothetical protein